jgi:hypothetical protein
MHGTSVNEVRKAKLAKPCQPLEFRRVGNRDGQRSEDFCSVEGVLVELSTFAMHKHIVLLGGPVFQPLQYRIAFYEDGARGVLGLMLDESRAMAR